MAALESQAVSRGLVLWSNIPLVNCPEEFIRPTKDNQVRRTDIALTWLGLLCRANVTGEEWAWACEEIAMSNRFWPTVADVMNLIKERRRKREGEKEWVQIGTCPEGRAQLRRMHPDEFKALPGGGK